MNISYIINRVPKTLSKEFQYKYQVYNQTKNTKLGFEI